MVKKLIFIVLFSIFVMQTIHAEETEQFTLPPSELLDTGPRTSQRLFQILETLVAKTNLEIRILQPKAKQGKYAASLLALRLNGSVFPDLLYEKTGPGLPRWIPLSKDEPQPSFYKETKPWKTVYWLVFSQFPLSLISLSPTINMYGHYFGADKLGHFFTQGRTYYKIYYAQIAKGKSARQAQAAIISFGKISEKTFFGILINGIYSNADLSANYAGWKFYWNLVHPVKIGDRINPPILILNNNQWVFNKHITPENLLKPYFSDNLNEALNPSLYAFMRSQISRQVKKRCTDWIHRKGITEQIISSKLKETRRWHGEEYGHWLPKNKAISLMTCFKDS